MKLLKSPRLSIFQPHKRFMHGVLPKEVQHRRFADAYFVRHGQEYCIHYLYVVRRISSCFFFFSGRNLVMPTCYFRTRPEYERGLVYFKSKRMAHPRDLSPPLVRGAQHFISFTLDCSRSPPAGIIMHFIFANIPPATNLTHSNIACYPELYVNVSYLRREWTSVSLRFAMSMSTVSPIKWGRTENRYCHTGGLDANSVSVQ